MATAFTSAKTALPGDRERSWSERVVIRAQSLTPTSITTSASAPSTAISATVPGKALRTLISTGQHNVAGPDANSEMLARRELNPGQAKLAPGEGQTRQPESIVMSCDRRGNDGPCLVASGERPQVESAHDLVKRSDGGDSSLR